VRERDPIDRREAGVRLGGRRLALRCLTVAVAVALVQGSPARSEDSGASPRRIAPELFPPYGPTVADDAPRPAPASVPSKEHPFGSCDRNSRSWLSCLRSTGELSDALVSEAEEQLRLELAQRTDLGLGARQNYSKALELANSQWRSLREQECRELALLEIRRRVQLYEARLTCQIVHNIERADELLSRYSVTRPSDIP
jgi:hypothetical protein